MLHVFNDILYSIKGALRAWCQKINIQNTHIRMLPQNSKHANLRGNSSILVPQKSEQNNICALIFFILSFFKHFAQVCLVDVVREARTR